jgi:ketosteroid isomerase-like protein
VTPGEAANVAIVRGYYAAVEAGSGALDWDRWFTPDVIQEEFPNRLLPEGARRDLAAMREAALRGQTLMAEQRFTLLEVIAGGDMVAVEAEWRGTVARDLGPFTAGMTLRTRSAQVLVLRGGKIAVLRNYDCFYPWS